MTTGWSLRSRLIVTVIFTAMALGVLALYWFPEAKLLAGDERSFYQPTALSILAGGDWFDRNMLWPPLQGLFIAGVYAIAGPHILAVQLVQIALLIASGLLLRRIWLALTEDAGSAAWAGVLLTVNPLTLAFATYLWPEIVHLFLSLAMVWSIILSRRHASARRRSILLAGLAGALFGLCLLSKSLLTAFWPILLLSLWLRADWRTSLFRMAAFLVATLIVISPALQRGHDVTGRWQIADSSWFNLWAGLADRPRSDLVADETGTRMREYLDSAPDQAGRVAFAKVKAQEILDQQGFPATLAAQLGKQYFRLFDSRNFLVAQLQGPPCRGYIAHYRIENGWLNRTIDYGARAWHVALLVLFALGLAAWRGWRRPWFWMIGAYVGYQLALFAGLHVKTRFLLPLLPVVCVFAAHLLAQLPSYGITTTPLSPARRIAGLLVAGVLVFLATAGPMFDNACTS